MAVMNWVWPLTALYGGPVALWGYFVLGRAPTQDARHQAMHHGSQSHDSHGRGGQAARPNPPTLRQIALSASHCGAGCMLADILGETLVFVCAWTIFGQSLYAGYLVTLGLAWLFGIAFQYASIRPMTGLSPARALAAAIRADTLSILFYQLGMYGWMAIVYFLLFPRPHLRPNAPAFWFMEQMGMIVGFLTTLPINRWLLQAGAKEPMD